MTTKKSFNADMLVELICPAVCLLDDDSEVIIFKHFNMLFSNSIKSS